MMHPALIAMLDAALADPAKAATLEADLDAAWGRDVAVLVVDMVGFTRLSEGEGIGAALLAIRRLQLVAAAIVERHGGEVIKCAADNVFAVLPTAADAQAAALAIVAATPASAGVGVGRILVLSGDFFAAEVNRASKLGEDEAGPGAVLLTPAAQTATSAPEEVFL